MKKKSGSDKSVVSKKRLHVVYKGRVHGVGFRYTAEALALDLGLTGWVKNLPKGDVELLAEGPEDILNQLLARIRASSVGRHIQRELADWSSCRDEFSDFRVEFVH